MNVNDIGIQINSIVEPVKKSLSRHIKERFPSAVVEWNDDWQLCNRGIISITGDVFYIDIETIKWVRFLRDISKDVVPEDVHVEMFPHTTHDTIEYYTFYGKELPTEKCNRE